MPSNKIAHHNNSRIRPKLIYVPVAPPDLPPDDRIKWALEEIQSDINKNEGKYPFSSRRPGIQEVLRRAGLGKTFLEKKGDDADRDARRGWRKAMIKSGLKTITGKVIAPSVAQAAIREDAEDVAAIKQAWHLTELELEEAHHKIEVLETALAAALARSP
ncbi:hypothetical protein [Neorhizobium galegae]|uniref:hypothetical protein n=1 Tax=Neorhizobium galegae TaxID=399 RepID=UPI002107CCC8|nr:hypothetical protein [Neorhizobium galegae]MCQ1854021.1 hypothetical protein [Neorhizobium galegae]